MLHIGDVGRRETGSRRKRAKGSRPTCDREPSRWTEISAPRPGSMSRFAPKRNQRQIRLVTAGQNDKTHPWWPASSNRKGEGQGRCCMPKGMPRPNRDQVSVGLVAALNQRPSASLARLAVVATLAAYPGMMQRARKREGLRVSVARPG